MKSNQIIFAVWCACCIATTFFGLTKLFYILEFLDYFEEPSVYNDVDCVKIMSIGASEDQTKFNTNSVLLTEWRVAGYKPGEDRPGAIYVASGFQKGGKTKSTEEFAANDLKIEELPIINYPEGVDFHPHGIYILKEDRTLYVINHAYENGGERIDVFGIATADDDDDDLENDIPNRLDYKYSITSEWMKKEMNGILNSVIAVKKNKFYVTQYQPEPEHNSDDRWLSYEIVLLINFLKSMILGSRNTYVWYCEYNDTSSSSPILDCRKVAGQFIGANGITHNNDYSKIFVSDHKTISVFDRDASTNDLSGRADVLVSNVVDNLKFDDVSGNVYGGTINNLWSLLKHPFPEESDDSTAGIVELFNQKKENSTSKSLWKAREVLSSSKLKHLSNGLRMNNHFVMGAGGIGHKGILVCPVVDEIANDGGE